MCEWDMSTTVSRPPAPAYASTNPKGYIMPFTMQKGQPEFVRCMLLSMLNL